MIQEESGTSWEEMYQVFNMGHRMELYVDPSIADAIIAISESFGVSAKIVGRVEESSAKELTISSEFGTFKYEK
jgi:phosphoribosylformylglycinamidine cyclo-ligase